MSDLEFSYPKKLTIPDRVCLINGDKYSNYRYKKADYKISIIDISFNVDSATSDCLLITDNLFKDMAVKINPLFSTKSGLYTSLIINDAFIPLDKSLFAEKVRFEVGGWVINDLIFGGLIEKGGLIKSGTDFVGVKYGGHKSIIAKNGLIYNKLME